MNDIQKERILNLLVSATEGGSNYWYMIQNHNAKEVEHKYFQEVPLKENGFLMIDDEQGEKTLKEPVRVDLKSLKTGYSIFKEKYPTHYADLIKENDDATTGDVFLQCVVFGEVIYG